VTSRNRVEIGFLWNLLGGFWNVALSFIAVPYLVSILGEARYGVYALVVVLLTYFQILDFGFSRALVRFGVESKEALRHHLGTTLVLQFTVALVAVAVLGGFAPQFATLLLGADAPDKASAINALRIAALSLAFTLAAGGPAAALRAQHRFGDVNLIYSASLTLGLVSMIAAAALGFGLEGVMWALALRSAVYFTLLMVATRRSLGPVPIRFDRTAFKSLAGFGGWVALSNGILSPLLQNYEKLVMGSLVSAEAVTYYMVPFRAVSQLRVLPSSLSSALFPHLSALDGKDDTELFRVSWRASELLLWVLLPFFSVLWIAGHPLLALWMGEDFATRSHTILLILTIGHFLSMLTWHSISVIHAKNRPRLIVGFYLAEAAIFLPAAYFLMQRWGAEGAAVAWTGRIALDAVLMGGGAYLLARPPDSVSARWRLAPLLVGTVLIAIAVAVSRDCSNYCQLAVATVTSLALIALAWRSVLNPGEQARVYGMAQKLMSKVRKTQP